MEKANTKFSLDQLHGRQEPDQKFHQTLCQVKPFDSPTKINFHNIKNFLAGESEDGEPLFVGRAQHEGTVTVGKIQPSHGVCYISYAGQELGFADYEVLVA